MSARNLSPREKQCITLLASGRRVAQIAHALQISVPAVRLYQSMGFSVEGVLKADTRIDGRYVDSLIMAIVDRSIADQ